MNEVHWSSRAEEQDRRGSKRGSEGDKVILTKRGKPFAAVARLREEKIGRLILEGRGLDRLRDKGDSVISWAELRERLGRKN